MCSVPHLPNRQARRTCARRRGVALVTTVLLLFMLGITAAGLVNYRRLKANGLSLALFPHCAVVIAVS